METFLKWKPSNADISFCKLIVQFHQASNCSKLTVNTGKRCSKLTVNTGKRRSKVTVNTGKRCEISSNLATKTPKRRH